MSRLRLNKVGVPSTPAAGKIELFSDSTDVGRLKYIDGDTGLTRTLTSVEWPRNLLANPGFSFAQRQVPGSLTTYSNTSGRSYGADRWGVTNENASVQYQQIDAIAAPEVGLQHRYYGKYKKITSAGKLIVTQVLEAEETAPLRGHRVRVSFLLKRTIASSMTVRIGLVQLAAAGTVDTIPATFASAFGAAGTDPTLGTNLAYIAPVTATADGGTISGNGMSCALTGNWVRYSVLFLVPADCKNLIVMLWSDGQLAANDELNVTQACLTDGPEIVEWTPTPTFHDLHRCQRFYVKTFPILTAPAQSGGLAGAIRSIVGTAGAVATSVAGMFWRFPVIMRATPATITFYNPSAANAFVRNVALSTDATVTAAINAADNGVHVNATGLAAWAVGNEAAVHCTADAEL